MKLINENKPTIRFREFIGWVKVFTQYQEQILKLQASVNKSVGKSDPNLPANVNEEEEGNNIFSEVLTSIELNIKTFSTIVNFYRGAQPLRKAILN